MNELLVIAWLLLPASALLIQYYLIQKRQNLLSGRPGKCLLVIVKVNPSCDLSIVVV